MNCRKDIRRVTNITDDDLIERARHVWREPFANFTVYDLLHAKGSPLEALLYAKLFWPEFRRLLDMTFLPFVVEDEADEQRIMTALELLEDRSRVEERFNRVEIGPLFGRRRGETSVEHDALLAQYLGATWSAKLGSDYPARRFCVRITGPEDGSDIAITIYEQR
jgi:hypothetical protein